MKYSGNYNLVDFVSKSMYLATKADGDLLFGCQTSCGGRWNDDVGWWALAALSGADLFGESAVISSSSGSSRSWLYVANLTLFEMLQDYDTVCGGGVYWSRDRTNNATNLKYEKSAITNAQVIWLATRLYEYTGDTSYLDLATSFWSWFVSTSTSSSYMIFDGVYAFSDTDCEWSYYYGIMAAYGAVLASTTSNTSYLDAGLNYYSYWKSNFIDASGNFYEPGCSSSSTPCKDPTGYNFPVYETLAILHAALPEGTHADTRAEIQSLMATQGAALVTRLQCDETTWLCVRTLNPPPAQYTFSNGTNPRDQLEMLSFVNAMAAINGAQDAASTPTAPTATTTSSKAAPHRADMAALEVLVVVAAVVALVGF
ncbi:hydrolase 76 protein [Cladochytrium tenue]|nr:hydrolase 76 protein [Cladochytrium tenue]